MVSTCGRPLTMRPLACCGSPPSAFACVSSGTRRPTGRRTCGTSSAWRWGRVPERGWGSPLWARGAFMKLIWKGEWQLFTRLSKSYSAAGLMTWDTEAQNPRWDARLESAHWKSNHWRRLMKKVTCSVVFWIWQKSNHCTVVWNIDGVSRLEMWSKCLKPACFPKGQQGEMPLVAKISPRYF